MYPYLLLALALGFIVQCLAADDPLNGPPHYHAMGDSYSAGPGAGKTYDHHKYGDTKCFRGYGAYGPKLNALQLPDLGDFDFLSCTGHVTEDVVKWQFPDLKYLEPLSKMRVTLSIGGNDLLFSTYIKACILGLPLNDCEGIKKDINNLLENTDGKNTLYNKLTSVWSQYPKNLPRTYQQIPDVWHTLYPLFFNTETDRCNNVRVSIGKAILGPKMTKDLRREVNNLVSRANQRIQLHLFKWQLLPENYWAMGQFHPIDYNGEYNGHRLCEEFIDSGVGFSNKDVWFLGVAEKDHDDDDESPTEQGTIEDSLTIDQIDPTTCDPNVGDLGLLVGCTMAQYKAQNPDADLSDLSLPKIITKAFHPKSSGFNRARDRIRRAMFPPNRAQLRVLALGDSITNGFKSTDGNGYRAEFQRLASADRVVDMIGSVKAGDMSDNDNEGHNGATIAEISGYADLSLTQRPNIILLHAGTNDMGSDEAAAGASDRLAALVDKLISKCPDATVLVSKLVPTTSGDRQARIDVYNSKVTSLVQSRNAGGRHVQLMHMDKAVLSSQLADGLHPNDLGYQMMGFHWYGGVKWADDQGWIMDPVEAPQTGGEAGHGQICEQLPGWLPQGEIANGGGNGAALRGGRTCDLPVCKEGVMFANITECGDNCAYSSCSESAGQSGDKCSGCPPSDQSTQEPQCYCKYKSGARQYVDNPTAIACEKFNTAGYNAVQFADIDGDGRDDYLWVDEMGRVQMYWNTGHAPDEGPHAGQVKWIPIGTIATGIGARGDQIRFADIDGDGRADYVWVKDSGAVTVWFNLGFDPNSARKVTWHSATGEQIASGIGDGDGVRFADINGDGKDDFIHLDNNAGVTLYLNVGRKADGGWGWWNWGKVASGVGADRTRIRFADMNGDGQADYCVINQNSGRLDVWYNEGPQSGSWSTVSAIGWWNSTTRNNKPAASGVSYLDKWTSGSMVTFGDLNVDGRDDYLYIGAQDSSVSAFINGC